jgi:hypothetical protein
MFAETLEGEKDRDHDVEGILRSLEGVGWGE